VLNYYEPQIEASGVLKRLKLKPREYFVVSAHREENVDSPVNLADLLDSLDQATRKFKKRAIVSTHPRTRNRLAALKRKALPSKVEFLKPLGYFDYMKLQTNAYCVLSDSGTLTEESSILGFPAIMIRQAHERPEGMDESIVIMSGLKAANVIDAIKISVAHYNGVKRPFKLVADYDTDNVSRKVLRIIMSYTDYVNRTVWFKT
jgi:UDP-N-acetylglucosamine 2-epimerase (non-hydrolysing)